MADCVRCWSSLDEAQRVAASLALSTAIAAGAAVPAEPRPRRDRSGASGPRCASFPKRLRGLWPAATGVLAAGAVAALAFALVLQAEVNDLRGDRDRLASDVQNAGGVLEEQRQLMAVLAAPDAQQINLQPADPRARRRWPSTTGAGPPGPAPSSPTTCPPSVRARCTTPGSSPAMRFTTPAASKPGTASASSAWTSRTSPDGPIGIGVSVEDAAGAERAPRDVPLRRVPALVRDFPARPLDNQRAAADDTRSH